MNSHKWRWAETLQPVIIGTDHHDKKYLNHITEFKFCNDSTIMTIKL